MSGAALLNASSATACNWELLCACLKAAPYLQQEQHDQWTQSGKVAAHARICSAFGSPSPGGHSGQVSPCRLILRPLGSLIDRSTQRLCLIQHLEQNLKCNWFQCPFRWCTCDSCCFQFPLCMDLQHCIQGGGEQETCMDDAERVW